MSAETEVVQKAARSNLVVNATKTAWNLVAGPVKSGLGAVSSGARFAGRTGLGSLIVAGLSLMGIGAVLKHGHDKNKKQEIEDARNLAPQTKEISQQIAEKKILLQKVSEYYGATNPDERNFVDAVGKSPLGQPLGPNQ
jgi:hypothetical protein